MRFCLAALLLFLAFARLSAQNSLSWPILNPEDYFAPNIRYEVLPVLEHDNESRQISYFDPSSNQWTSYPYPDEIDYLNNWRYLADSNGTYLLRGTNGAWYFHPDGSIQPAEMLCGMPRLAENEGSWYLIKNEGEEQVRLCHSGTGEMTSLLPEISPNLPEGLPPNYFCTSVMELSAELLLIKDCSLEEQNTYFSYDLASATLLWLGSLPELDFVYPIDEDNLLIVANMEFTYPSTSDNDIQFYHVRTRQENSAVQLFSLDGEISGFAISEDNRHIYISEYRASTVQEGDYDGWRFRSYDVLTGTEDILFEYDFLRIEDEAPIFPSINYLGGNIFSLSVPAYLFDISERQTFATYDGNTGELLYQYAETYYLFADYYWRYHDGNLHIYQYIGGRFVTARSISNLRLAHNAVDFYAGRYLLLASRNVLTSRYYPDSTDLNTNPDTESYFLYDWEANDIVPLLPYGGDYAFYFAPDETGNPLATIYERYKTDDGGQGISRTIARWRILLDEPASQ